MYSKRRIFEISLFLTFYVGCFYTVKGLSEDERCTCVCPVRGNSSMTVHRSKDVTAETCKCEYVVRPLTKEDIDNNFCLRCACEFEKRNTTTIKVVIIIVIVIIALLCTYMVFLLVLDPLMSRRQRRYLEHQNEEDTVPISSTSDGLATRSRAIMTRVRDQQNRWKGTVQEQRKNIYDRHTMLN